MSNDPYPNQLGTDAFSPEENAMLLAEGCVFAIKRHNRSQRLPVIFSSTRPMEDVATDLLLDAHRLLRREHSIPTLLPIESKELHP